MQQNKSTQAYERRTKLTEHLMHRHLL